MTDQSVIFKAFRTISATAHLVATWACRTCAALLH